MIQFSRGEKMKKLFCLLLCLSLFFTIFNSCTNSQSNKTSINDSVENSQLPESLFDDESQSSTLSESESFYQESSSQSDLEESVDNKESIDDPQTVIPDENDLSFYARGRAPENYGTTPIITQQSDITAENSNTSAMGTFNCEGAPVYQDYMIWAFAEFSLSTDGNPINLTEKGLTVDILTQNCGNTLSMIILDEYGNFSNEVPFDLKAVETSDLFTRTTLERGWTRIEITLKYVISEPYLKIASKLLLTFSNVDSDRFNNSVFYVDNLRIIDGKEFSPEKGYNPDCFYSKTQNLKIKFTGNSFIRTSNIGLWFEQLANFFGANVSIEAISIGNARIENQIEVAFSKNAGFISRGDIPDVIFLQDFYGSIDLINLEQYLIKLKELAPSTEVKILPGENETDDGKLSSTIYGLDFTDWKGIIKYLKAQKGLTSFNLNAYDGWHPNSLSGYVGALMAYIELYGEIPNVESTVNFALQTFSNYFGETHVLGSTHSERIELLTTVTTVVIESFK